ncbi:MAG TPA: FKBP-type peptidyl-prolyl cis-trans isomerase [bacterium]
MTRKSTTLKWLAVLGVALLASQAGAEETPVLKTLKEKVNYGIGVDLARSLKRQGIETDADLVMKGLKDGLAGEKLLVPEEDLNTIMIAFRHELSRRQAEVMKIVAAENKAKGEAFLAENRTKTGVVTLPSGLQYKILTSGDGAKPAEADTVECRYRGTLLDGTELDSSGAETPASFKVTAVIPGWKEALQLMPEGSKWQLFIPPHLAYGERGGDARIGPNQTLIFELELVSVRSPKEGGPQR